MGTINLSRKVSILDKNVNFYRLLGVNAFATAEEVRRAYRILARRYHPDLNPGDPKAENIFKMISQAYQVLNDAEKKKKYDKELESYNSQSLFGDRVSDHRSKYEKLRKYAEATAAAAEGEKTKGKKGAPDPKLKEAQTKHAPHPPKKSKPKPSGKNLLNSLTSLIKSPFGDIRSESPPEKAKHPPHHLKVSVIEASIHIKDSIFGTKKTLEIHEPEGARKISVKIPAGVKNGSVIRLRSKSNSPEELILIVHLIPEPHWRIENRGVVLEVPVTAREALEGGSITIKYLGGDLTFQMHAGCQSGEEIRIESKGIHHSDGTRGDLFLRPLILLPPDHEAVGLHAKVSELDPYYANDIRKGINAYFNRV